VDDVPDGRGVLFEVLRVGMKGTDKEINDAEYGDPLRVMTSWKLATSPSSACWRPGPTCKVSNTGNYVVATAKRPGTNIRC
jgi:hypothetical protein